MMLSVIIATRDRTKLINNCLNSILSNTFTTYEILIIDQSKVDDLPKKINSPIPKRVKYFRLKDVGKSKSLNFGLQKSRGEIIVFIDDDCIVDKDWLENINQSFQKNKNIVGIFGKVLPYNSQSNKEKICPCIFLKKERKIITKPCLHWKHIGFGNNMVFKRMIFDKLGSFKEWLGAGSIAKSTEDAEFALRCLIKGYRLFYDPKIIVYHNRWLTKEQYHKQSLSYSCGEVACYGYFCFQGLKLGKQVVVNNFKDSYWKFRKAIKSLLFFKKKGVELLLNCLEELFYRLRGFALAWYFSKKEPI